MMKDNVYKKSGNHLALLTFLCFLALPFSTWAQYTGSGTFTQISSMADLTDGYYVIAEFGGSPAMNNVYNGTFLAPVAILPVGGEIADPDASFVWKIETNEGGRTIYNEGTAQYVSYTGSSNNVQVVSAVAGNNQRWSFSYTDKFLVANLAITARRLQYNSGAPRFACYTGSQKDLTLYKLSPPDDNDDVDGASDLIISEYVEGSSSNKYIELYNGTGAAVDLSAYALEIYSNGSASGTTGSPALSGILPNETTIVYQNSSAAIYAGAINNSAVNFNGNDALALLKDGVIIDIVGTIGNNADFAENVTLRRNLGICSPNPVFNQTGEWNTAGIDDASNLGTHEAGCSLPTIAEPIELGLTCPENLEVVFDANCQAVLPDFTAGITEVVLASPDDFSGVQGDVWEYGMHNFGDWQNFTQLPNFTGFVWNNPGSAFDLPQMDALGGHPEVSDPGRVAVRRWTSNLAGEITVYGDFFDRNTGCGDGANVRIYQNGNQFYEYLNVPSFSIGYSQNIIVAVGDVIDFVIDRKFDGGCDDTHFTNNIKVSVTESQAPAPGTAITELTVVSLSLLTEGGAGQSCQFEVVPADNTAPEALCQDLTLELDEAGEAVLSASEVDNGSTDNCGVVTLEISQELFTCDHIGAGQEVTLTVTDLAGNSNTCTANVTVVDLIGPELEVNGLINLSLDENGQLTPTVELLGASATDNCGDVVITVSTDDETLNCDNIIDETNFADDLIISTYVEGSSNNKYVEVYNGTGAPVNLTNYDLRLYANGSPTPTTVSNLGEAGILAHDSVAVFRNSQADIYAGVTYVLSAVNFNGDDAFDLFNLTTGTQVDIFGSIGQDPGSQWSVNSLTTADQTLVRESFVINGNTSNASGFPSLGQEWIAFPVNTVDVLGSHTNASGGTSATVTATDENGNTTVRNVFLIISDDLPPVLVDMPGDISLEADPASCSAVATWTPPTATDNCEASLNSNYNSGDAFPLGETLVEYTATDPSGNDVTASFTVSVTAPLLEVEISVIAEIACNAGNGTISATATGGCEPYTYSWNGNVTDAQIAAGAGLQTVEVTDANGETATAQITLAEPDALVLTTSTTAASCADTEDGTASVTIEGGTAPYTIVWSNGADTETAENLSVGSYDVTVTDFNGCEASANVEIGFSDTTPPNVIANSITVELDANGLVNIVPADIDGGSTDACGIASLSLDVSSFSCANTGANAVLFTATDVNGNSASQNVTVTVEDNIAPTVITQNITIQLDASGNASITTADVNNGSSDACGIESLALSQTDFDCSHVGTNNVDLTVTDLNGNEATASAVVTVVDNVAPTVITQNITIQLDASGNASITTADVDNGSEDACGIASLALSQTDFDCSHIGTNDVDLTATDVNGNEATASAVVTVEDNVDPTAVCQDITVQLDASGFASIEAAQVDGGSTDNCSVASLSLDQSTFDCTHIGGNMVELTVVDASGNTSTCNAIVTVLEPLVLPTAEIASSLALTDNGNVVIFDNAPASINLAASVVLTATLSPSDFNLGSYQWAYRDLPDGSFVDIAGATDAALTIESDGDSHREYRVEILTATGCEATATIVVFSVDVSCKGNNKVMVCHVPPGNPDNAKEICVSVNAVDALLANSDSYLGSCDLGPKNIVADKVDPEVQVYPNPSWGRFMVTFKEAEVRAEQIFVFDMQGRKVMGLSIQDYTGAFQIELNLGEYENGMYMMTIVGAGQVIATERIMKTQ